jgi:hypothetical protein
MYASGTAPLLGRESYAAPAAVAAPERGDDASDKRLRAVAPPDGDAVAGLPADPSAVAALPGSPMEGMLAVFGDFLRSAFEQLGRMLATMVSPSPSAAVAGNMPSETPGSVAQDGATGDLPDGTDAAAAADAGSAYGNGSYAAAGTGPAGGPPPSADAGGRTHVRHGHAHRGEHLHQRRGRAHVDGAASLRPGQRWDLGDGESVMRGRDGSLRITVGGAARDAMSESGSFQRSDPQLEPGLL